MLSNSRVDDFSLPGYDVDELLGFGGSGEVWRAREHATGELVALKRLRPLGSPEGFAREAALLASVRHDHVVRLRGVVPCADALVLVLEFAEGGSLASLLAARERLSPGEVVTIGAPLAQALSDIHARGLVHGDVTPANIVFDGSGKPLLADLGVASLAGEDTAPMGATAGYADPALVSGAINRPGPPGDVHGLAAVCFSALAGVPPYSGIGRRQRGCGARARAAGTRRPGGVGGSDRGRPRSRPRRASRRRRVRTDVVRGLCARGRAGRTSAGADACAADPRGRPAPTPAEAEAAAVRTRTAHRGRSRWSAVQRVMIGPAVIVAGAVALLGGAVAGGVAWASHDHRAAASPVAGGRAVVGPVAASPAPTGATDWAGVLRSLDSTRDSAFVDTDVGRLRPRLRRRLGRAAG